MAADQTLVRGAAIAAPKFNKIELFSEAQLQQMEKATMLKKARKATRDAAIGALVSDITVNESLTPPQQINAQYEAAGNIRNQVAALAAQRAKLPVNSPEAFALDQQISTLKQSFTNIANNAKDFQELQKEYVDGSWNMSGGVSEENRNKLDAIFAKNEYTIQFDERGNATYVTEFGNMSQKDLSNYYVKDDEMALSIVGYSDEALQLGSGGTQMKVGGTRYNMLKTKVRNDLRKGGEARINSLIYDDLVEGQSLGLTDLGDQQANEDAAVDAIMNNLMNVNAQGYSEYKSKPSGNKNDKDNRTPGEIQRSKAAQADKKYVRNGLMNMSAPDPNLLVKPKKDTDGTPMVRTDMEEANKIVFLDHTMDETNKVLAGKGKITKVGDKYMLQKTGTSVSGQILNEVDVTDQMNSYITGDREALFQVIERNIFDVESIDYEGSADDPDLNPNT